MEVKRRQTGRKKTTVATQTNIKTETHAAGNAVSDVDVDKASDQIVYKNILKNHLILETLCRFVSIRDMKMMRYVCTQWNYEVGTILFRRSWCSLELDARHWNHISNYMTVAATYPNIKLFINFRLLHMNLTDANLEMSSVIAFFEQFGKGIKRLVLRRCCLDKGGDFWINLVRISKWTNKLQELILEENYFLDKDTPPDSYGLPSRHKITVLRFFSSKREDAFPCELNNLWQEFPVLETLQLIDLTSDNTFTLLKAIHSRSARPQLCLRNLDIFREGKYCALEIPENLLNFFCELNLPLAKLRLDIGMYVAPEDFALLVRTYGPTLKEFVIQRGLLADKIKTPAFPFGVSLPALEFLEIPESCLADLSFIQYVPNLIRLTIRQCSLNPISYDGDRFSIRYITKDWKTFVDTPHTTLQELKIEFKPSEDYIQFLRKIFLNLHVLSIVSPKKSEAFAL